MEKPNSNNQAFPSTSAAGLVQGRAYRNLNREFAAYLGEFGLSMSEWAVLGLVAERSGLSQKLLAGELDVTPPMAAKIVANLERRGYILRSGNNSDNRVKNVSLSGDGRACIDAAEPVLRARMAKLLEGVSRADLAAYIRVLNSLASHPNKP